MAGVLLRWTTTSANCAGRVAHDQQPDELTAAIRGSAPASQGRGLYRLGIPAQRHQRMAAALEALGGGRADRKPVKNRTCGGASTICTGHDIEWHWVKGHSGHPDNERADALANHVWTGYLATAATPAEGTEGASSFWIRRPPVSRSSTATGSSRWVASRANRRRTNRTFHHYIQPD